MPSSSFPRKGRALLLSTAAAGLALSAAMAASPAVADNECGALGATGTVTCAAGTYANGITYSSVNNIDLTAAQGVQSQGAISVNSAGNGSITNNGSVNSSANSNGGLEVNATSGSASIFNNGDVTVSGTNTAGLFALSTANTVTIDNSATGTVVANGTGTGANAITATSLTGSTITNEGTLTAGPNGFAIAAGGGSTQITNSGTINGPINLTSSGNTVNNSGTWNVTGTNSFGSSGTNNLNNTGTIVVAPGVTPSNTSGVTFTNLATFDNSGALDMRSGNNLDIRPANFNGNTGSQLLVLANGQNGVLSVGSSSGLTSVEPTDVLGRAPGKLNLGGSLLVTGANQGTFDLAGNPNNVFHKGFVDYVLEFNQDRNSQTGTYTLFGLPGREVFEALSIPYAAETYWQNSSNAWSQRAMSIRDSLVGNTPSRPEGWEVWVVPYGGHQEFDRRQIFSFGGFDFDSIGTHTAFFGLQAGADIVSKMDNGYGYWGFTGGMEQQETDFIGDNENNLYLIGGNLGMYGGINWGGFYFNALGKVDFINLNANFNSAGFSPTTGWMTWGGTGEIGYRFPFMGFFVEPAGRVSGIWTNENDLFPAGGALHFNNDNPIVMGQAGGRIGYTLTSGVPGVSRLPLMGFLGRSFDIYGGAFWADQWSGRNGLTFVTGTDLANDSVRLDQRQTGPFIRAEYGAETTDFAGGLKLFFKGENDFNGDGFGGWAAQMGFRFSF